jgi:hypothetical protein
MIIWVFFGGRFLPDLLMLWSLCSVVLALGDNRLRFRHLMKIKKICMYLQPRYICRPCQFIQVPTFCLTLIHLLIFLSNIYSSIDVSYTINLSTDVLSNVNSSTDVSSMLHQFVC